MLIERERAYYHREMFAGTKSENTEHGQFWQEKKTLGTFGNSSITKKKISRITATNLGTRPDLSPLLLKGKPASFTVVFDVETACSLQEILMVQCLNAGHRHFW